MPRSPFARLSELPHLYDFHVHSAKLFFQAVGINLNEIVGKAGFEPAEVSSTLVFAKLLALIAAPVFMIFKLCTTHLN